MTGAERIVGRSSELSILVDALNDAVHGQARVVFVTGEAGIGKTRLIGEFARLVGSRSVPVVWGRATTAEGAPAFWPWRQVFRSWADEVGVERARTQVEISPDVRLIAPELDGFGPRSATDDATPVDAEHRFTLFEDACSLIAAAAEDEGMVIVLDDLHWADAASLRLLVHLVASVRDARLLVVAAYRPGELRSDPVAAGLLDQMIDAPSIRRLTLDGLTPSEVGEQLGMVLGAEPDDELIERVARRTGGNPLFVQEVGRLLAVGSESVPTGVQTVLDRRLASLGPTTRRVLSAAAVVGTQINPATAAALADGEPLDVLTALDEAITAGLVRRTRTAGGYAFAHDLVRDCCLLALGEADRAALHLAAAEHLERAGSELDPTAVAHHRIAALPLGDPGLASAAAERASQVAVRQLAYEEGARLLEQALAAAEQADAPPERRTQLLLDLARVQHMGLDGVSARATCERAAAIAEQTGDIVALARAALVLEDTSEPMWVAVIKEWCDTALDRLPDSEASLRARLLALLGVSSLIDGDNQRLDELSSRALVLADQTDDPEALGSALRARQLARSTADGVFERLELADRMAALAARTGDTRAVMWGHLWRFDAHVQLGHLDDAEAEVARLTAVVEQLRQPLGYWHLHRSQAAIHLARGRFDQAIDTDQRALDIAKLSGHDGAVFISSAVRMWWSSLTGGDLENDEIHPPPAEVPAVWAAIANLGFGEWHLAFGRLDEAYRHYAALPPMSWQHPPFLQMGLTAGRASLAAGLGDGDTAATLYPELLPFADYHAAGGAGAILTRGSVHHFLGVAAAAAGDVTSAVDHLEASIAANRSSGLPPQVADSSCRLAELLVGASASTGGLAGDRSAAAADLATEAKGIADRLGMRLVGERADAVLARLGPVSTHPLSRRECEVARLVADGLTNRRIAEQLHIAERTAENHVQHILTKLGHSSRTQIAVWVAGGGLADGRVRR